MPLQHLEFFFEKAKSQKLTRTLIRSSRPRVHRIFTNRIAAPFWLGSLWYAHIRPLFFTKNLYTHTIFYSKFRNISIANRYAEKFIIWYSQEPIITLKACFIYLHRKRITNIFFYIHAYSAIFFQILTENHFVVKKLKSNDFFVLFRLYFTFRRNRLFIVLKNKVYQNFFYISLGFLIKYFAKKKSLKKTKALKLIMAQTLRKMLLVTKMPKLYVFIRGVPIHLDAIFRVLNKRIDHKFVDPIDNTVIDETSEKTPLLLLNVIYMFFWKNNAFVPVKTRKRGRIKRKLRRKLVALNNVTD